MRKISGASRKIREAAGLTPDFRPDHVAGTRKRGADVMGKIVAAAMEKGAPEGATRN